MADIASEATAVEAHLPPSSSGPPILRACVLNDQTGITVVLEGELNTATGPGLFHELDRLLEVRPRALTVDLSRVASVDTTGVSVLNTTRDRARNRAVPFALQSASRSVRRVFDATALWEHLDTRTKQSRFEDEAFEW